MERWKLLLEPGVDSPDDLLTPLSSSHVHERGPRGVAVLHRGHPREMVVEVVVGEENRLEPPIVLGLVSLEPEDLWGRVTREEIITD